MAPRYQAQSGLLNPRVHRDGWLRLKRSIGASLLLPLFYHLCHQVAFFRGSYLRVGSGDGVDPKTLATIYGINLLIPAGVSRRGTWPPRCRRWQMTRDRRHGKTASKNCPRSPGVPDNDREESMTGWPPAALSGPAVYPDPDRVTSS